MKAWPAIDVGMHGAADGRPELFQAALVDHDAAAIDETTGYRVFFHEAEARDRALAALAGQFPDLPMAAVDVPDEDWAARSQAGVRAIRIGDLVVAPPWDIPSAPIVIVIQPSMGFGTGHHATTRLCLAALQALDLDGRTVLDVGTGSGVLAIAACRLGAARALGIDDDGDAVQAARENVELNAGVAVTIDVLDIRSTPLSPFDVVLANLTGGLLLSVADRLEALTAARGALVLSGFMDHEEAQVLAAFGSMQVADRRQEDEWVSVTLRRRGTFE
jgi:ribosomal protein L11 methyltransferase